MDYLLSNKTVSISELKKNLSAIVKETKKEPIAILNHNSPSAYLLSPKTYKELIDTIEDYELGSLIKKRKNEESQAIKIRIDEL